MARGKPQKIMSTCRRLCFVQCRIVLALAFLTGLAARSPAHAAAVPPSGVSPAGSSSSGLLAAADERPLSLDQAVSQALERHPAVLQAAREIDAALGRRLLLGAVPNPELSFEAAGLPLWNSSGEKEFSLGIRQLLEFPGKRRLRTDIGRSGENQARLTLDRVRNIVRGRVERAYFRAAYAQKHVDDLESLEVTLREYVDLAAARYSSGQVPYLDVVRGRLEVLRLRNDIVEARKDLKHATIAVDLLMGVAAFEPARFTTEIPYEPIAKTYDDLKTAALSGSAIKLTGTLRRQAELSLALARKTRLPDFVVGLFTPSKRLGAWGFEVGLSLPLRRQAFRGAVLEARAGTEQAAIAVEGQTRRVLLTLERAYADAKTLEEQIGLFRDAILKDIEDSLKAGLTAYQYGKSDALGVLDIVRSLKETQAEFLRALLNHELALIDIATAGEDEAIEVENVDF